MMTSFCGDVLGTTVAYTCVPVVQNFKKRKILRGNANGFEEVGGEVEMYHEGSTGGADSE